MGTVFILGAYTFVGSIGLITMPAAAIAQESAFKEFLQQREIPKLIDFLKAFKKHFQATWKYGFLMMVLNIMVFLAIPFWFAAPRPIAIASFVFILPLGSLIFLIQITLPGQVILEGEFNFKRTIAHTFLRLSKKPFKAIALLFLSLFWISILYAIPTIIPFLGFSVIGLAAIFLTQDLESKER